MRIFGKRILWLRCWTHAWDDDIALSNDMQIYPCRNCTVHAVYARIEGNKFMLLNPEEVR